MIKSILHIALFTIIFSHVAYGQSLSEKYTEDVKSIDAIIDAYYDVISGSSSDPWQFERDKYIHSDNAVIIKIGENGTIARHTLEAEYVPFLLAPREDFYEVELKRVVDQFGDIAQVWSAFEVRSSPETATNIVGLNSIQLHFAENRWWIDGWTTQMETEKKTLVTEFLKGK